ncbi:MAG: DUF3437 domain-containing protein [Methanobacteriota archaeon]|nr:MAG: DUF3437 domain-containing protein [Euryarchaeota archaeon]
MARQMSPAFARRVVARITDWLATATPFPNTLLMSVVLGGFSQCEAAVSGLQSLLQSSLTTLAAPDTPDTRLQWHAAIAVGIVANPDAAAACVDMLVRAVQRLVSHSEKKVRKEGLRLLQYTLRSLSYVSVAPATQGPSAAFAYGTPALQHFDTLLTRAATGAGHVLPQLCDTLQARVDAPTPARRRAALDLMNAMLVPAVAALYEALPSGFQPTVPSFAAAAAASTPPHASTEAGGDGGSKKPRKSADLLARHTKLVSRCLMGAFAAIPEVLRDVDDTLVHLGSNCARFVWCPLRRCVVDENDEIAAGSSYVNTLCSLRAALTLVAVDLCVAFQRDDVLSRNASLMRKLVAILRSAAYLGSHVVPWQIVTTHESHSSDIGEGGAFGVTSIVADVIAAIERAATCGQLPDRYAAIVLYPQPLVSWISWVRSEHRQYGRRANAKRRMLRWLQHQADGTDAVLEGEQIEEDGGEEDDVEEVEAEGEADEVLDDEEVDADEATMGMGEQDHDELVKSISVARSLALPAWQDAAVLRERLSHLLGTSAPDNVAAAELPRLLSMAAAMDLSRHPLRNVVELAVDTMVRLSTLTPWLYNPLLQKTLADSSTLPSVPGMDAAVVSAPAAGLSASPAPEPPSPDAAAGGATSLTDVSLSAGRDLFCRITSIVAVLAARWSRIVTKAENVPDYVRVLVQCEALVLSTRQPEVQRARQAIAMLLEQCVTYWNPMSVRRASNAVSEEATLHDVQARIMHIMYPTYNVAVDVGGDSAEPARAARVLDSRGAPVSSAAPLSGCQVRPGLEASLGVLSAFVTPVVLRTLSSPLLPAATTASVAAASKRPPPQTVECAEAVWLWCMSALLSPDKAVVRGAAAMLARCLLMRWMKQQSALALLPLPRVHALMRSASYVSQLVMALTGVVAAGRNTITLQWPNLRSPETTFHAPFALLSELMCMLFPESAPLLAVALEELVEARAGAGASFPGTSVPGDAGSATAVSDNPALQPEGTHDQSTVVRRRIVAVHLVSGMLRFSVLAGVWRGTNTTSAPSGPTSPTCESDIECTAARAAVAEKVLAVLFHLVKTGNSLSIATLRRAMLHILHGIPRVLRTRLEARIVAHVVRVVARTRQHVDTALSESCLMGTSLALRVVDSASDGASAAASTAPGAAATFAAFGRWVALLRAVLQAYRVSTSAHGTSCLNPLLTNAQALQLCYGTLAAVRNLSAADMQDDVAALAAEDDVTGVLFSPELREGLVQLLDHPFQDCRFAAGLALGALIQVQALPQYVSDVSGRGEWATAWEAAFYSRALGKAFYWFVLNRTTSSSEETPEKTAATNFMEALLLMLLGLRQGVLGICQWAPAAALFPAALRACQASQSTLSSYADTVCTKLGQLPWRPLFACDEQRALRQWRSLQLVCQQNFSSSSACAGVLADLEAMPLAAPRESSSSAEAMASRAHLSCASIMFALFQRMVILPAAASSTNQHQSAVDASPALVPAGSTTSGGAGGSGASSRLASWTVRFGALTGFQRSWQSQYLNMAPHQQEELLRLVCTALRDESVEVQDAASELLVSTILCMPLEVQLRFAHDQVTSARAVKLPAARRVGAARGEDSSPPVPAAGADKQKGMKALRTRTAHVRAALAVMRSHPFDLPAALVDVVDALTRFAQDPAPIGFAVKQAFKDFYHTHQDNWTAHRDMFTPDQLTNFMEVLGTPSYFA